MKTNFKKSLGQNFLVDENMLKKIVSIVKIENRSILEVGPGTGNLTSCILKNNPKKLIVIEKDNNLVILLKKKFKEKIEIINSEIEIIPAIFLNFINLNLISIIFLVPEYFYFHKQYLPLLLYT